MARSTAGKCAHCGHLLAARGESMPQYCPYCGQPQKRARAPKPPASGAAAAVHMSCPVCPDVDLRIAERSGVEIDYCPSCRGVWLDRGELDKIIERASRQLSSSVAAARREVRDEYERGDDKRHHDERGYRKRKKKRKSFLGELFDFDFFD